MTGLNKILDGFAGRRVLLVGDLVADEFVYGEIARVSREAPVLLLKHRSTESHRGRRGHSGARFLQREGTALE